MTRYVDGGLAPTISEDDPRPCPEHTAYWEWRPGGVKGAIRDVQYSRGYYGNEASTTTFYASAASDHGAPWTSATRRHAAAHRRPRPRHEGALEAQADAWPRPAKLTPKASGRRRATQSARRDDGASAARPWTRRSRRARGRRRLRGRLGGRGRHEDQAQALSVSARRPRRLRGRRF